MSLASADAQVTSGTIMGTVFVRTYPVYFPGREPEGYWDMLRNSKPKPLITPGPRTKADWMKEGRRIFRELDIPYVRNYDPKLVEICRSADEYLLQADSR